MHILTAMDDPKVFGTHFTAATWTSWRVFLAALFALPLDQQQLALYQQLTGRTTPPANPHTEAWLVCGRRSGKSFTLALIAVFLACFKNWRPFLGPGEVGTIMLIAGDRRQARVLKRFITGFLRSVPMLAQLIESETQDAITLRNRIVIEIHTANFRSVRGYTVVACLLDEIAFWPTDENSASPDVEVLNALRPAMLTVPGAMLLCASSPHARHGMLWESYHRHYGKDGDKVLVWQAPTTVMNANVPQAEIDAALEADPSRASAEYLAQFRADLEAFVTREVVEQCVERQAFERPVVPGVTYSAFCDPSGGSADSMTLAIAHFDYSKQIVTIDAIREAKPPFSPEQVTEEFCKLLKAYKVSSVVSDRFGGGWVVEQFSRFGIIVEPAPKPKSELYVDLLPLLNSKRIELLDHLRCFNQLINLERSVARGGRSTINHPPGQHDDVANAVAGAASMLISGSRYNLAALADALPVQEKPVDAWRQRRYQMEDEHLAKFRQPPPPLNQPGTHYFDPAAYTNDTSKQAPEATNARRST
jgi:hypothetical protein